MDLSYKYFENDQVKIIRSEEFNCFFNKENGNCITYGKTIDDDVDFCPYGPLIADIEVTTICSGINNVPCKFCYKSNTTNGKNMSFETFKTIFDKFPNTLQQIAFGTDSKAESNPDLFKMFEYCLENGVKPNLTVADISDEIADKISKYSGACSVSRYADKNFCYDSVKKLTDGGMSQVNIHQLISEETFEQTLETIDDIKNDKRLEKLNAIVFLSLKKKGRGKNLNCLSKEKFNIIIDKCIENEIRHGLDSCSGKKYSEYCKDNNKEEFLMYITGCESTLQSVYCNHEGKYFPCSFTEDENDWKEGIDLTKINDFIKDVWYNEKVVKFRNSLKGAFCNCPVFNV